VTLSSAARIRPLTPVRRLRSPSSALVRPTVGAPSSWDRSPMKQRCKKSAPKRCVLGRRVAPSPRLARAAILMARGPSRLRLITTMFKRPWRNSSTGVWWGFKVFGRHRSPLTNAASQGGRAHGAVSSSQRWMMASVPRDLTARPSMGMSFRLRDTLHPHTHLLEEFSAALRSQFSLA
jgi:hypothetical protein